MSSSRRPPRRLWQPPRMKVFSARRQISFINSNQGDQKIMIKKITAIVAGLGVTATAFAAPILINGAGATFPYPIYSKWFDVYTTVNPDVRFNYQSIGSGGGIKQVSAGTVDFGGTDGPMTDKQLAEAPGRLFHIPTV